MANIILINNQSNIVSKLNWYEKPLVRAPFNWIFITFCFFLRWVVFFYIEKSASQLQLNHKLIGRNVESICIKHNKSISKRTTHPLSAENSSVVWRMCVCEGRNRMSEYIVFVMRTSAFFYIPDCAFSFFFFLLLFAFHFDMIDDVLCKLK